MTPQIHPSVTKYQFTLSYTQNIFLSFSRVTTQEFHFVMAISPEFRISGGGTDSGVCASVRTSS